MFLSLLEKEGKNMRKEKNGWLHSAVKMMLLSFVVILLATGSFRSVTVSATIDESQEDLVTVTFRELLEAKIVELEALAKTDYPESSQPALREIIEHAQTILNNPDYGEAEYEDTLSDIEGYLKNVPTYEDLYQQAVKELSEMETFYKDKKRYNLDKIKQAATALEKVVDNRELKKIDAALMNLHEQIKISEFGIVKTKKEMLAALKSSATIITADQNVITLTDEVVLNRKVNIYGSSKKKTLNFKKGIRIGRKGNVYLYSANVTGPIAVYGKIQTQETTISAKSSGHVWGMKLAGNAQAVIGPKTTFQLQGGKNKFQIAVALYGTVNPASDFQRLKLPKGVVVTYRTTHGFNTVKTARKKLSNQKLYVWNGKKYVADKK